jgi:hypothetical protein
LPAQAPDRPRREQSLPWRFEVFTGAGLDGHQSRFRGINARVRARVVAVPPVEEDRPDHPGQAKEQERRAPGDVLQAQVNQQRGERAAEPRAHPHNPLRPAALAQGQPAVEGLGQVRKRAGLPCPKQELRHDERPAAPHPAQGGGAQRPPDDDPQQYPPRAEPVAQVTGGNLKQGISQRKGAEHPAHLFVA